MKKNIIYIDDNIVIVKITKSKDNAFQKLL